MARYIDADKLEKAFKEEVSKHNAIINNNEYPVFLVDHTLHKIRNYPTADVVEVKHGEWVVDAEKKVLHVRNFKSTLHTTYKCSLCGCKTGNIKSFKFCRDCGAEMKGDKNV